MEAPARRTARLALRPLEPPKADEAYRAREGLSLSKLEAKGKEGLGYAPAHTPVTHAKHVEESDPSMRRDAEAGPEVRWTYPYSTCGVYATRTTGSLRAHEGHREQTSEHKTCADERQVGPQKGCTSDR